MSGASRRSWVDLTPPQRVIVAGAGTVQVSLLVAALTDLRRRADDEVKGPKALWAAVAFVNWIGPLAYYVFGRRT